MEIEKNFSQYGNLRTRNLCGMKYNIMHIQTGLEPIINNCCNLQETSFIELREQIITNFTNCDLSQCSITELQLSKLKESNGRKLIMTRPKFREYFRKRL